MTLNDRYICWFHIPSGHRVYSTRRKPTRTKARRKSVELSKRDLRLDQEKPLRVEPRGPIAVSRAAGIGAADALYDPLTVEVRGTPLKARNRSLDHRRIEPPGDE
jgi:hypothetical protein